MFFWCLCVFGCLNLLAIHCCLQCKVRRSLNALEEHFPHFFSFFFILRKAAQFCALCMQTFNQPRKTYAFLWSLFPLFLFLRHLRPRFYSAMLLCVLTLPVKTNSGQAPVPILLVSNCISFKFQCIGHTFTQQCEHYHFHLIPFYFSSSFYLLVFSFFHLLISFHLLFSLSFFVLLDARLIWQIELSR